ncbi:hypothetical protein ACFW15_35800, partial [Streptomyces sp. NPDC058953]
MRLLDMLRPRYAPVPALARVGEGGAGRAPRGRTRGAGSAGRPAGPGPRVPPAGGPDGCRGEPGAAGGRGARR